MTSPKRKPANSVDTIAYNPKIMHLPGEIVGEHYQIIQKLGREELGKTYLAKNLQATGDSRCAIEQLKPQAHNSKVWQKVQTILKKQVYLAQKLGEHPQIPHLYDNFSQNKQFYLVREYIDGDNLEQKIKRQIFDEAETIHLLQDVLRILDFAHKLNIVHRDIKPSHIIKRKQDGNFVLIDFAGLREIEALETEILTSVDFNQNVGAWGYVAPEQKAGNCSFSSDIYALGKTAIYALTGKSPRELEQTNISWQKSCQISHKLQLILEKMVQETSGDRYSSALDVLLDLKPLLRINQIVGGRYRITRYLGGSDGIDTYLAENLRRHYQSICLIKQVELSDSDAATWQKIEQYFTEELTILERLGYHDQIPQLWDHFEENESFYLVQEYIQGENLAKKLERSKFQEVEVVQLLESTLLVLAFIHQHHIIHRNIKPSNLIVPDGEGEIVLTDFGFLKDIRHLPQTTVNSDRATEQKNYLPPEQIAGRPTTASDLYALGIIAIEALTQTKPDLLSKDPQTGAISWRESIVVNRRLGKILDKMTHLDVGQRYQSAEQVLNDLSKIRLQSHADGGNKFIQSRNLARFDRGRLKPIHILIALVGLLCFLGSMEFTFPTLRPIYYSYRGKQLLSEQPEIALNTFMKAIDLKPESAAAWEGRGDALYQLERFPEALEAYYEAIQLNSDSSSNYQTWQKKGNTLYNLESFSEALIAYDRALELKPDDPETLNQKGKTLYQLQRYQEALEVQEEALKIDRFNPQYLSDRATVLMDLGRYYDALTVFNRVQAIAPLNLRLWQNKAITLKYLNRPQESRRVYQEVMDEYDKIIKQQPQNKEIWLSKADFLLEFSKYREANAAYDKAIAIVPRSYFAWLGKAKALNKLQEYDQALAAIDKALNIRPKSALAWQVRGLIFHKGKSNLTEAIASYDRAIEFNPNFAPAWRDRGFALTDRGKYSQASESFAKASEINPYDLDTWLGLATTLTAMEQNDQALFVLERALQIKPQDPSIWLQKGSILVKQQKYNEACENYRQSRKVTPESAEILQAMQNLGCRME
ncbi:MAG: hypothetical protein Tsb0014_09720 [Pleurocapsa sp.]